MLRVHLYIEIQSHLSHSQLNKDRYNKISRYKHLLFKKKSQSNLSSNCLGPYIFPPHLLLHLVQVITGIHSYKAKCRAVGAKHIV